MHINYIQTMPRKVKQLTGQLVIKKKDLYSLVV